jgi:hypothetical protein
LVLPIAGAVDLQFIGVEEADLQIAVVAIRGEGDGKTLSLRDVEAVPVGLVGVGAQLARPGGVRG